MRRQAQEQQQQESSEAQLKLAAAQASRDKVQAQLDKTQDSNGSLHKQLADAHGKVCVCVCVSVSVCVWVYAWAECFGAWSVSSLAEVVVTSMMRAAELVSAAFCFGWQHNLVAPLCCWGAAVALTDNHGIGLCLGMIQEKRSSKEVQ